MNLQDNRVSYLALLSIEIHYYPSLIRSDQEGGQEVNSLFI